MLNDIYQYNHKFKKYKGVALAILKWDVVRVYQEI
jgi:hypothetical protein